MSKLNPSGMFTDDLKELAQLEAAANSLAEAIDNQIAALKDIRSKIMQPSVEKRETIIEQSKSMLEAAGDDKNMQKLIKGNMHHLITVRQITDFTFDEEAAREYIIEHKLWDMIRKPTVAKSAVKKKWKEHDAKWLTGAEESSKTSITIGKLGELLIVEPASVFEDEEFVPKNSDKNSATVSPEPIAVGG